MPRADTSAVETEVDAEFVGILVIEGKGVGHEVEALNIGEGDVEFDSISVIEADGVNDEVEVKALNVGEGAAVKVSE